MKTLDFLNTEIENGKSFQVENTCPLCKLVSLTNVKPESLPPEELEQFRDLPYGYIVYLHHEHSDLRTCVAAIRDKLENHEHGKVRW